MCGKWLGVWWCGVSRPCKSADDCVARVDDATAGIVVEDRAMVLLEKSGCMLFTAVSKLPAGTPFEDGEDDGMGLLCKVPGIGPDAGLFFIVVGVLLCDARALRKKAWVVSEVDVLGRSLPCCKMLVMLPTGAV